MTTARIYSVTKSNVDAMPQVTLVKANSQAQALRHVARSIYSVRPATALEVAHHMQSGMTFADATADKGE